MLVSVVTFIVVLSLLVLVHELGHFIVAKKAGVLVEEFGFGIPPRVFGKKIGETIYSLNLLPFGGFVRLHGENTLEGVVEPGRAFLRKSKKTRTAIVVSGVLMNFALALLAFSVVYFFSGIPRGTDRVKVIEVAGDSPAAAAGFKSGDVVVSIDGVEIKSTDDFIKTVSEGVEKELRFTLERDGSRFDVQSTPRKNPPQGEGPLGVIISTTETYYPPYWQRPFYGMYFGLREAWFWMGVVIGGFVQLFRQLFQGVVPRDIAGPVGIFALTSQAASFGLLALVNFVGILSVNLAILNILPFPALDGGRLLFIAIESLVGRRVVPKIENIIHTIGMVILLMLLVAVTYNDIRQLIAAGSVSGFIEGVLKR